jgi:hypothetical protein
VVRSGFIATNVLTLGQRAEEDAPPTVSDAVHQANAASIPELASQWRGLPLPTGPDVNPPTASGIDTTLVHARQGAPGGPIRHESTSQKRREALRRIYDRPRKKPAVTCELNVARLQELSRQRGGQGYAIAWIPNAFTNGVTAGALIRTLSEEEINAVGHDHGFRLSQVYNGFLEKVGDRFACGLCPEEKRANWQHKRDAIRHFQKFHFGIGETCGTW